MAISVKLQELLDIKQDIKEAIENKGADLTGVEFSGYAEKIDEIETGGGTTGGYSVCIISSYGSSYNTKAGYLSYSLDNGTTWVDIISDSQLNIILNNVTQIKFKLTYVNNMDATLVDVSSKYGEITITSQTWNWTGSNIILSENKIYDIEINID